jgi:O-acetyl-ADP-ribose deacetylase (regulator of RNase III)
MPPSVQIVHGDLLDQRVDVIVNAWNRNVIPWWLLIPQGVSRAIKKRAGREPFHEVARHGPIPLGGAVLTGPGRLPFKGIIHVAGISMLWRSSERSIRASVSNAVLLAEKHAFRSVAMPLIGAGTGGGDEDTVQAIIEDQLAGTQYTGRVVVVRYLPNDHALGRSMTAPRPCRANETGGDERSTPLLFAGRGTAERGATRFQ